MNRIVFPLAFGILLGLAAPRAEAQEKHAPGWSGHPYHHGYHGRPWHRPDYWGHSWRHHHHRGWSWSGSFWADPWVYAAPLYPLRSYREVPVYVERVIEPEPVYVERIIEREPVYVERPYYVRPRPELRGRAEHVERSHARIDPDPPRRERIERTTLSATELFEFDKATLRLPQPRLDEIADVLLRNPQIERVTITGYADRLGSDEYNLKLSMQRAAAVKAYLVSKGIAAHRLAAVGKGEAEPVVECNDKDRARLIRCLEPNRRVVVEQITVERRTPVASPRRGTG